MIRHFNTLRIFIGYDPIEAVAYHTLAHSILTQSSEPVSITPVNVQNLPFWTRPRDHKQSNEFSLTRFLVPYLAGFEGWALFMDCDMMLRGDISEVFEMGDENMACHVVKHEYQPVYQKKYLGNVQYSYPRKNWSSVVLWNCGHHANRVLTPDYVQTASPQDLHRFAHLEDDQIGELPLGCNWLVEDYSLRDYPKSDVKIVHWTNFGPWLAGHEHVDFADEWFEMRRKAYYARQK